MPYSLADLPFFLALPVLLLGSAFFSGCETALFGLSAHERARLAGRGSLLGQAIASLLSDPRTLLVTLMLGNMTVNVLYFVVSSALLLKLNPAQHPFWAVGMTIAPLLMVIVFGEVLPKMVANLARLVWVQWTALPLYAAHQVARPGAELLSRWVIQPLGRVIAPPHAGPKDLSTDELSMLLKMSQRRGVIGDDEQELLRQVVGLSDLKVRDVMVPRVDVVHIDVNTDAKAMHELIAKTDLTKYVAVDGDLDHVLGIIYARQFLLAERLNRGRAVRLRSLVRNVRFVPEIQWVVRLLEDFRKTGTNLAVVVDEYGGTAGFVTLKDVVEQMVGDLDMDDAPGEGSSPMAEQIGQGQWRVSGRLSVHDWAEAFGAEQVPGRIATVGGLIIARLGRLPKVGDVVRIANVQMQVESVRGGCVQWVALRIIRPESQPEAGEAAK